MENKNEQLVKTSFDFLCFNNAIFNFYSQLSIALISLPFEQLKNKDKKFKY